MGIDMTVTSTPPLATDGEAAEPMPTVLSPVEALRWAKALTALHQGEALHRAFDKACCELLCSLGFGDFVEEFMKATKGYHA